MLEIIKRVQVSEWDGDIEWITIPLSDDLSFLSPQQNGAGTDNENRRSVEVAVFPASMAGPPQSPGLDESRPFSLLDYVYFSIYTISTTGYGDIMPVSPFCKLVSSIANIFEVVFIVIFFNVLTSFLTDLGVMDNLNAGSRTGGQV